METIIGLLIVILPVAFKLIGKALEDASETPAPTTRRISPDTVEPYDSMAERRRMYMNVRGAEDQIVDRVEEEVSSDIEESVDVAQEQNEPKKDKKIDPKKLVLYSEIMKPKF